MKIHKLAVVVVGVVFGSLVASGAAAGPVTALRTAGNGAFVCAVTNSGGVICWGNNQLGQLGNGNLTNQATPVAVIGLSGVADIGVGGRRVCALTSAGALRCWGEQAVPPPLVTPAGMDTGVTLVGGGDFVNCARKGDQTYCWGSNTFGELGTGSTGSSTTIPQLTSVGPTIAIAGGNIFTCALTAAGAAMCWGGNNVGQLGDGTTTNRATPATVSGLGADVAAISTGANHACALKNNGEVWCWGRNADRNLGDGTNVQRTTPVQVAGLGGAATAVAAGDSQTCALVGSDVKCWGRGLEGQLGQGSNSSSGVPVSVSLNLGAGVGVQSLKAADSATCILTTIGTVWCWGRNTGGELGNGSATNSNIPVLVNLPSLTTGAVTSVGTTTAIANGNAVSDGTVAITARGACWSTSANPGLSDTCAAAAAGGTGAFTASMTGLLPNTQYHVRAYVTNAQGTFFGDGVTTTTPPGPPFAPTNAIGTAGNAQVNVNFAAPLVDGGSPITGYTVTASPGGASVSGPSSPILVTGLTNGTNYTFTVTATNSLGTGPASTPSAAVMPAAVPGAPTGVTATAGNGQASVSFTAPASNGGVDITGYTVTASPGGPSVSSAASPVLMTGLTNGTAYTFTVTATNSIGTGPASTASSAVTPSALPGAPTNVTGVASNGKVSVGFTAPSSDGGATITSYTVTTSPGGTTVSGASSPIVVSGLTNGSAYIFTVTATNANGTGPASAASAPVTVPMLTATPAALRIGATKTGATAPVQALTQPQTVVLTFAGVTPPQWTATSNQPWLQISNGSGTGGGFFTVSFADIGNTIGAATSLSATITIQAPALELTTTIPVSLTVKPVVDGTLPFGSFDTPAANATVDGAVMVSGWALDDIGVERVEIWRDRAAGETTPVYTGGGPGNGKIYIADVYFVAGARPDVEAIYSTLPASYRAGWGYLLLTHGLWNQGNGAFMLHAIAYDREGRSAVLGSKTITASNATATTPFGTIDTPAPGQRVSGAFWNFGWALTPNAIPSCSITNGNVRVSIDSQPLVPVSYGDLRSDIAAAFPGYTNANGAGGAYYVDTATLSNGLHVIGWYVVDSCNRAAGIGSRFFTVANGSATVPTTERRAVAANIPVGDVISNTDAPVMVRSRGELRVISPNPHGHRVVVIPQAERVEVELPVASGEYAAYAVAGGQRRELPLGSSFDAERGIFYWQPVAGFFGAYDLEFVPVAGESVKVRVVVGGSVQAAIDTPLAGVVSSSFEIAGWAIDQGAAHGTGIDTVHVWAYPADGGNPTFLGVAAYGGERRDIAAAFGEQFAGSGYLLAVGDLKAGSYTVVVYPHSSVTGDFHGARTRVVTVQ
jgi:alpha-tubulin suppressor-like RCC1 family protein